MGLALVYLLFGLVIGFVFGLAVGKVYAWVYLDEDTNIKVEKLRANRIEYEEVRLQTSKIGTLSELTELAGRLKELVDDIKDTKHEV